MSRAGGAGELGVPTLAKRGEAQWGLGAAGGEIPRVTPLTASPRPLPRPLLSSRYYIWLLLKMQKN
ncbi:hypothetical protein [Chroococcidiopsis sp. CCMEE 29]|uniref:hypothetical protein n=1 Tax=Chroococcidiopsis sp. CCMEE 29 TaxID=155894 RepID=UPI002021E9E4|nr:hypothetical protein [Chroococcidiopsis sp. CCMEE 29]